MTGISDGTVATTWPTDHRIHSWLDQHRKNIGVNVIPVAGVLQSCCHCCSHTEQISPGCPAPTWWLPHSAQDL